MQAPHALPAGRPEVAGNDPIHARVDRRLKDRLLIEDRFCADGAQEDFDTFEVLGELGWWVRGKVADADLDTAPAQGAYVRLGRGGRAG